MISRVWRLRPSLYDVSFFAPTIVEGVARGPGPDVHGDDVVANGPASIEKHPPQLGVQTHDLCVDKVPAVLKAERLEINHQVIVAEWIHVYFFKKVSGGGDVNEQQ